MHPESGLTRSSVNLRGEPHLKSSVIAALDPQEHVRILDEVENMFLVQPTGWAPPVQGYILKSAIAHEQVRPEVFPRIDLGGGVSIPAVPESLPLSAFLSWLETADESPWLPADYLDAIRAGNVPPVGKLIRQAVADRQMQWDSWVAEIRSQRREDSCTLGEWLVILAGGQEVWSFRTERLFAQPSQHGAAPAWIAPNDVLHWTGHVCFNDQEPKYKLWYEVEITKLDREFKGWYKASLLHEFVLPTPETDITVTGNEDKVFDLSRPALRLPADPEFDEARRAGRSAAQYINIQAALGSGVIQHNLCGQLCVAALVASDIIPLLKQWISSSPPARELLAEDRGTTTLDVEALLRLYGKDYEFFRAEPGVAPLTPDYLRQALDGGRMAIALARLNSMGEIKAGGKILHWVVLEDFLPVANSGWVRLYNPFQNREEVHPLETVFNTTTKSTIGLWLQPDRPFTPRQQAAEAPDRASLLALQ